MTPAHKCSVTRSHDLSQREGAVALREGTEIAVRADKGCSLGHGLSEAEINRVESARVGLSSLGNVVLPARWLLFE